MRAVKPVSDPQKCRQPADGLVIRLPEAGEQSARLARPLLSVTPNRQRDDRHFIRKQTRQRRLPNDAFSVLVVLLYINNIANIVEKCGIFQPFVRRTGADRELLRPRDLPVKLSDEASDLSRVPGVPSAFAAQCKDPCATDLPLSAPVQRRAAYLPPAVSTSRFFSRHFSRFDHLF